MLWICARDFCHSVFFSFINNLSEHLMLKGTGRGSAQIAAAFQLMYFRDAF